MKVYSPSLSVSSTQQPFGLTILYEPLASASSIVNPPNPNFLSIEFISFFVCSVLVISASLALISLYIFSRSVSLSVLIFLILVIPFI